MKPVLAVDWDGTLNGKKDGLRWVSAWPENGQWIPGGVAALRELKDYYRILIHTSRIAPFEHYDWTIARSPAQVAEDVAQIRDMLDAAGLRTVGIHQEPFKPGAKFYVDDHAINFSGRETAWAAITARLLAAAGADELFPPTLYPQEVR